MRAVVRTLCVVVAIFSSAAVPTSSAAQESRGWNEAGVRVVVEDVATWIEGYYVFPEIGARYARALRDRVGAYSSLAISELASRITADLQRINRDLHLRLTIAPTPTGGAGVRVQRTVGAGGGEPAGTTRGGGGVRTRVAAAPPEAAAETPRAVSASPEQLFTPMDLGGLPEVARRLFADEARRNHFFTQVEILPGNVGYLDYDQFGFPNFSTDAADASFAFLAETDALILDLRDNPGGIEGMNQYLASHFFGEEPVHLYSRYYGAERTTVEHTTFPEHVVRRFPDLPLYILVNGGTGSAAENFTFALQGLGRAIVVGEATAGAAHSSQAFPVSGGLMLQLPVARAFNPRTNQDWDGDGVQPDVASTSDAALAAAHTNAVDQLLAEAPPEERVTLEDAKLLFAARGAAPEEGELDVYVGHYGSRRVYLEEGRLKMVRTDVPGIPAVDLVPLAPGYFTLQQASSARVRFERSDSGEVVRIHVRMPTGAWEVGERR